jgi:hypothetical protein
MRNRLCLEPRLVEGISRLVAAEEGQDSPSPESSDLDWFVVRMIVLTGNRRSGTEKLTLKK